jgi:hypothetical protein
MTCNVIWTYKNEFEQSHQNHNFHKPWIPFTKHLKLQDRLQPSSNCNKTRFDKLQQNFDKLQEKSNKLEQGPLWWVTTIILTQATTKPMLQQNTNELQ